MNATRSGILTVVRTAPSQRYWQRRLVRRLGGWWLGLAVGWLFAATAAQAANWTNTWTVGTGTAAVANWSSPSIWVGGIVPGSAAGDTLYFSPQANGATIINDYAPVTLGSMSFPGKATGGKNYVLSAGASNHGITFNNLGAGASLFNGVTETTGRLTIGNPITLADDLFVTNNASSTAVITLDGIIGESGGSRSLIIRNRVAGDGGVNLAKVNSYSGATHIESGTLTVGKNGAIPKTSQVSIAAGAAFDVSATGFTFLGTEPQQTLAGRSASGTASINASGTLTNINATVVLAPGARISLQAAGGAGTTVGRISIVSTSATSGNLSLNDNTVTVNTTGSALAVGTYRLLDCAGTLTGVANQTPTFTGTALTSGHVASVHTTPGLGGRVDLIVQVSVPKMPTVMTLSSSSAPSTYGQTVSFTATVQTNGTPVTAATGSVFLKVDGILVASRIPIGGIVTFTNTTALFTDSSLPVGSHAIVAEYGGDINLFPSSSSVTQTVNKGTPVLTAPIAGPLSSGQTLASAILVGGRAINPLNNKQIPGSFAFTSPSLAPNVGTSNVSVTFTPVDTVNDSGAITTVAVTVLEPGMTVSNATITNDYAPVTLGGMTFLGQAGESYLLTVEANNHGYIFDNGGNGSWLINGNTGTGGVTINNPIALADNLVVTNNAATTGLIALTGLIGESGGSRSLTVVAGANGGTGGVTLAGVNTYTGPTTVASGKLSLASAGAIASPSVVIAAGATFDTTAKSSFSLPTTQTFTLGIDPTGLGRSARINAAGLNIIDARVSFNTSGPLDDPVYVIASYTSRIGTAFAMATPPAGYAIDYAYASGTQIALVQTLSGYALWSVSNAGGEAANLDTDKDGVANGIEYFMDSAPGFTANPPLVTSGAVRTVTWMNGGNIQFSDYGSRYVVQTSADLTNWTNVLPENVANTSGSVMFTLPTGTNSNFVRLSVSDK
jgi:autotransporter-associated beta strand protein